LVSLSYINNATQRTNGIGAVDNIAAYGRVLHDAAGDHDDILGGVGQLLDDQIDHLAERGIFVLEQLRDAEEEARGFVGRELLAGEEEQRDLGEENAASAGRDGGRVEDAGCQ
jgi:hypothetical protein